MKGYIQGKKVILLDNLPNRIQEGDEVEIIIQSKAKKKYPFATFKLGVKDEYLNREKIYEQEN
ncbi:hypothetical protein cce_3168 [Crocosphaera subtropica ATCC 51142]|uniref:Uncharacterized protein n=1 Tax=Crocosphaera subtropica (strain ATCC 51142 / BH68) TaxID=43989 RepID=B1WXH5_CROS5|nr:hypothetical protein [Crocosphaera subtropica]ACB52516.1 hypothetical protein cce_3168 [Crocosphaera subtropica ATCC 51142]